ncbi:MAG TPA: hypothetical protein ENI62_01485, partial [Gammaproteobacteria bacterium]|nr:hypothetical protein [Gammaproteobacteria bacterium]
MTTSARTFKSRIHNYRRSLNLVLIAGLTMTTVNISGCLATTLGVIVVTSVDVVFDRRTVGNYIDDNKVELKIFTKLQLDDQLRRANSHVNASSMNGIVLLTGEVPNSYLLG